MLDGDNVRHGLCVDLGFSDEDRKENVRRVGETTKHFVEGGMIVLTAFISPYREDRDHVRGVFPHGDFIEVFCDCPLEICEQRDVKGLYKRARAGGIKHYTGIDSPYEKPEQPELVVETGKLSLEESVDKTIDLLRAREVVSCDSRDIKINL